MPVTRRHVQELYRRRQLWGGEGDMAVTVGPAWGLWARGRLGRARGGQVGAESTLYGEFTWVWGSYTDPVSMAWEDRIHPTRPSANHLATRLFTVSREGRTHRSRICPIHFSLKVSSMGYWCLVKADTVCSMWRQSGSSRERGGHGWQRRRIPSLSSGCCFESTPI